MNKKAISKLKKGDIVLCPKCEAPMVKCIKKPKLGAVIGPDCFEPIEFKGIEGDVIKCPHDVKFVVYTKDGWKS